MAADSLMLLDHPRLGRCQLLRVEGMNWVVRSLALGHIYMLPSSRRAEFQVLEAPAPPPANEAVTPPLAGPSPARRTDHSAIPAPSFVATSPPAIASSPRTDQRTWLRVFESIRIGLPAPGDEALQLAVGMEPVVGEIDNLLQTVAEAGGGALLIRGAYGQGKTFSLRILEERALKAGYLVACTEIDANEIRLDKPHLVYGALMRSLRIPGVNGRGASVLARQATPAVQKAMDGNVDSSKAWVWLREQLQCRALAWLFSDFRLPDKPLLISLLGCEQGIPIRAAREAHCWPCDASIWPAFSAGTQGDFASYLLSGIGRLARLLGHKGLIVILDEMEKWQELNWLAQGRAGNLLGGLIWAATAHESERSSEHEPRDLRHSGRGFHPFTTPRRCHLGVALALTPRGDQGPERLWARYGPYQELDLPHVTPQTLAEYVARIGPWYAGAYNLPEPSVPQIARTALATWRGRGDGSFRTAVQSVIDGLDAWRDGNHSDSSTD